MAIQWEWKAPGRAFMGTNTAPRKPYDQMEPDERAAYDQQLAGQRVRSVMAGAAATMPKPPAPAPTPRGVAVVNGQASTFAPLAPVAPRIAADISQGADRRIVETGPAATREAAVQTATEQVRANPPAQIPNQGTIALTFEQAKNVGAIAPGETTEQYNSRAPETMPAAAYSRELAWTGAQNAANAAVQEAARIKGQLASETDPARKAVLADQLAKVERQQVQSVGAGSNSIAAFRTPDQPAVPPSVQGEKIAYVDASGKQVEAEFDRTALAGVQDQLKPMTDDKARLQGEIAGLEKYLADNASMAGDPRFQQAADETRTKIAQLQGEVGSVDRLIGQTLDGVPKVNTPGDVASREYLANYGGPTATGMSPGRSPVPSATPGPKSAEELTDEEFARAIVPLPPRQQAEAKRKREKYKQQSFKEKVYQDKLKFQAQKDAKAEQIRLETKQRQDRKDAEARDKTVRAEAAKIEADAQKKAVVVQKAEADRQKLAAKAEADKVKAESAKVKTAKDLLTDEISNMDRDIGRLLNEEKRMIADVEKANKNRVAFNEQVASKVASRKTEEDTTKHKSIQAEADHAAAREKEWEKVRATAAETLNKFRTEKLEPANKQRRDLVEKRRKLIVPEQQTTTAPHQPATPAQPTTQPAATASQPRTITTKAERDALPSGTEYTLPDGSRAVKR